MFTAILPAITTMSGTEYRLNRHLLKEITRECMTRWLDEMTERKGGKVKSKVFSEKVAFELKDKND